MRRALQSNGLGLCFAALFPLTLLAQAAAGTAEDNEQQRAQGLDGISLAEYVITADFAADVAENRQSEFLQFLLFILATVWLVQRGSPERSEFLAVGSMVVLSTFLRERGSAESKPVSDPHGATDDSP